MAEITNRVCTYDHRVKAVAQLAEAGDTAGYEKMMDHFALPLSPSQRFEFLSQVKQCFDSERQNHPNLPKFEYLPQIFYLTDSEKPPETTA